MLLQNEYCIIQFGSEGYVNYCKAEHTEQTRLHMLHELRNCEKLPNDPTSNRMNEYIITERS